MQENRACTVCNKPIKETFCSTCGQKMKREETTVRSIFTDFFQNLFSLDKSVFATIYSLLKDSRKIISNYWSGYRRYYPSPGKLLVYAITFAAIQLTFIHDELLGLTLDIDEVKGQFLFWILFFPLILLTSYLSFFRLKFSFTKHLISIAYIASSFFIVFTLLNTLLLGFGINLNSIPFLIFLIAVFIWNALVNTPSPKIKVLQYTLIQLFCFLLIVLVLMGTAYLINPNIINFG